MLSYLKSVFTKNWGLKLLAFVAALVLWLTLIPEEKTFSEKKGTIFNFRMMKRGDMQ
jgi:hypothetical protein